MILTNSGQPLIASEDSVKVTPSEVYAPNPTAASPNAKAPSQPLQPDSVMVSQVRQKLSGDTELMPVASRIFIQSENGTVSLVGSVPDDVTKAKIEARVNQVPGVVSINDQLQVTSEQPAPPPIEPAAVNAVTPQESASAPKVVQVPPANAEQGLTPTGSSPDSNNRVYAANVPTPVQSSNYFNVQVQGSAGTDPAEGALAQRIVQELQGDATLVPVTRPVEILVGDGKITLTGTVSNQEQKQRIQAAVQRVSGFTDVDNRLRIKDSGPEEAR
jgi:osmotically-inducible protein OsmY